MRAFVLVALSGCGGFGAELGVAEPGLREDGAAADEERDGDGDEDRDREVDVEACADLLVRCLRLGVSDDTALRAFDECARGPGREGDEEREGDERDGDERDGDEGGDERDGEGDPERPA